MAHDYVAAGFAAVIDDFWDPPRLVEYEAIADGSSICRVLLEPTASGLSDEGRLVLDTKDLSVALLIVGLCTLGWWRLRLRGLPAPPRLLMWVGRLALLAATALRLLTALPHVRSAAGVL